MAIVLALLITGWLLAFALGAQAGFDNKPTADTQQRPKVQPVVAKAGNPTGQTSAV